MTTVSVSPSNPNSTHHISLTDGKQVVGLTAVDGAGNPAPLSIGRAPVESSALKTAQGNQKYSDLTPPYAAMTQATFDGGRGQDEFEDDTTAYDDGLRVNTERSGRVIMGPRERYCSGLRHGTDNMPGSLKMVALTEKHWSLRRDFHAVCTAGEIWLWVRYRGTPKDSLWVDIKDSGLNTLVDGPLEISTDDLDPLVSRLYILNLTTQPGLDGDYHLFVWSDNGSTANHWEAGCLPQAGETYQFNGSGYDLSDTFDLAFRVVEDAEQHPGKFFTYYGALYCIISDWDAAGPPKLYLNGARGAASDNAGQMDKLICGEDPGWETNEWVGCTVQIVDGYGLYEAENWRTIVANDSNTLTVDHDWRHLQTNETYFVIIGSEKWTEIAGHGLTYPCSDVCVSDRNILYICQRDAATTRRMREYGSAGVWTREFSDDSAPGMFMTMANFKGIGNRMFCSRSDTTIAWSEPKDWGDNMEWSDPRDNVGDKFDRIVGLQRYVDPSDQSEAVWVMKEAGPWIATLYDDSETVIIKVDRAKVSMKAVASPYNGAASCVQEPYLYMSVLHSVDRFYSPNLDDIGPDVGRSGLPPERQGHVTSLVPYPGRIYTSWDAGLTGYSSVMATTGGSAWHETYRAPYGKRIFNIFYQVIPGEEPDRLWVLQGEDIVWLPFPSKTFDPERDEDYLFTHEGVITLSRMFVNLYDAYKFWKSLKIKSENLDVDQDVRTCWMEADYRLDSDEYWKEIPDLFSESPMDEAILGDGDGVSSKAIQIRIRMYTADQSKTPKLLAVVLDCVVVATPKFGYYLTVRVDRDDRFGSRENLRPEDAVLLLDEWAGTARPLKMACINPLFDNRLVFLNPTQARPLATAERLNEHSYVCTLAIQEA